MVDFCQYTIRLLSIFKAFDLKKRGCFALVDDDQKQQAIEGSGEMESNPQRSYGKELCTNCPHPPKARLCFGTRKRRTLG